MLACREALWATSWSRNVISGRTVNVPSTRNGAVGLNATTVPSQLLPTSTTSRTSARAVEAGGALESAISCVAHETATIGDTAIKAAHPTDRHVIAIAPPDFLWAIRQCGGRRRRQV